MKLEGSHGGLDLSPDHPNYRLAKELAYINLCHLRAFPKVESVKPCHVSGVKCLNTAGEGTKGLKLESSDGGHTSSVSSNCTSNLK